MPDAGYSFTPGAASTARSNYNRQQLNPQQSEALRVLSLRLPQTLSGRPIAPEGLLQPGLSRGSPFGSAVGDTLAQTAGTPSAPPSAATGAPGLPSAIGAPANMQPLSTVSFGGTAGAGGAGAPQGDTSSLAALVGGALNPPGAGPTGPTPNIAFQQLPRVGPGPAQPPPSDLPIDPGTGMGNLPPGSGPVMGGTMPPPSGGGDISGLLAALFGNANGFGGGGGGRFGQGGV